MKKQLLFAAFVMVAGASSAQCPSMSGTIPDQSACNTEVVTIADPLDGNTQCFLDGNEVINHSIDLSTVSVGAHQLTCQNSTFMNPCVLKDTAVITVKLTPVAMSGLADTITFSGSDTVYVLVDGTPSGGTYTGTGVNGGSFNSATSGAGTFSIYYTVTSNGCTDVDSSIIVVEAPSNILAISQNNISLYPNPTYNMVEISLNAIEGIKTIEVVDLQGRVIISETVSGNKLSLNLSSVNAGVYYVKVTSGDAVAFAKVTKM